MKNDGSRPSRFDMIANQMMKGITGSRRQGNTAGTPEEIEDFKRVYGDTIAYLERKFPKSSNVGTWRSWQSDLVGRQTKNGAICGSGR